jgi:hypothetical protein
LTAAYGYLDSPEALHPDEPVRRLTASLLHGKRVAARGQWASAFVWGANKHPGESFTHSFLVESEAVLSPRDAIIGRAELVQKSAGELVIDALPEHELFDVTSVSLGYIRELVQLRRATLGLGVRGTINFVPEELESAYGSRTPTGFLIFLRVRPRLDLTPRSMGEEHVH